MSFRVLVVEELRALPRSRFGMIGCALLLGFVALLAATLGTLPRRAFSFLLPAYGFAPALLIPIAASAFAQARASGYLDALLTAPVRARDVAAARFVATLALGAAYLLATTPFLLVEAAHVGLSGETLKHVALGVAMVGYSAAMGTLIGVLFTSRGTLAALSTAVATMIAVGVSTGGLESIAGLSASPERDVMLRILHLSGGVLLTDALGIGDLVRSPAPALAGLLALGVTVAAAAGALVLFARHQSASTWEVRGPQAAALALVLGGILLAPAALASVEYERVEEPTQRSGWSSSGIRIRLVSPGEDPPPRLPHHSDVVPAGRATPLDLVILVWPDVAEPSEVRDLRLRLDGEGMSVAPGLLELAAPQRDGPSPAGTYVLRVPVTLETPPPTQMRGNVHTLLANGTYVNATGGIRHVDAEVRVLSDVPRVAEQMAAAGAIAPAAVLAGAALRRWRMR